jgi:hypothetical protein
MDAMKYWVETAPTKPEAQALATRLGLEFPDGFTGFKAGMMYPMRRLIVSGEDTPANMLLLFGPTWEADTTRTHEDARRTVLLSPPPGSPSHTMAGFMDQGLVSWRPRPANAEEEVFIQSVMRVQKQYLSH